MLRFTSIFSILVLSFGCGSSSQSSSTPEAIDKADQQNLQLSLKIDGACNKAQSDGLDIRQVELAEGGLSVVVGYTGGCTKHEFEACWDGRFLESFPVQTQIRIIHHANNDMCEALVGKTLKIDLSAMAEAYRGGYQTEQGTIRVAVNDASAVSFVLGADKLTTPELEKAFVEAAKGAIFMSEADYSPEFISASFSQDEAVSLESIKEALNPTVLAFFKKEKSELTEKTMAFELSSAEETKQLLVGLAEAPEDGGDVYRESAEAWARVKVLLDKNLTDVTAVKIGSMDDNGELAMDYGLYCYIIVGKTVDGQIAGLLVGVVET